MNNKKIEEHLQDLLETTFKEQEEQEKQIVLLRQEWERSEKQRRKELEEIIKKNDFRLEEEFVGGIPKSAIIPDSLVSTKNGRV